MSVIWIKIADESGFTVIKVNEMIPSLNKCFLQLGCLEMPTENFVQTKILMKGSEVTSSEFHGFKMCL